MTTVAEARWLETHGADVVIAQGTEAGGHQATFLPPGGKGIGVPQQGTLTLIAGVVGAVGVPVVAAGGIADARGIATALRLRAAGVQMGTAYLLYPEASTTASHREAMRQAVGPATVLTDVFTGRPARAIVNRLLREVGPIRGSTPDVPLPLAALAPLRAKAEQLGRSDFTPFWAGQAYPSAESRLWLSRLLP